MIDLIKDIGQFIGWITPFLIFMSGIWIKNNDKKQNAKAEIRNKLLLDKITELEITVKNVEGSFICHVNDDKFRNTYRKTIKFISTSTIKNPYLHQDYKHLLTVWGDLLEKFGMNYYYCVERKLKQREREKYLFQQKNLIIDEFNKNINETVPGQRTFKNTPHTFNEFLEKTGVYNSLEVLIVDLGRNGLSDEKYNEKFEDSIDKFCDNFVNATVVWDKLELFKFKM